MRSGTPFLTAFVVKGLLKKLTQYLFGGFSALKADRNTNQGGSGKRADNSVNSDIGVITGCRNYLHENGLRSIVEVGMRRQLSVVAIQILKDYKSLTAQIACVKMELNFDTAI